MRVDSAAFAELVRRHQAMVYSIAWYYLRDQVVAEDISQEVFLELHRRISQIESDDHAKRFLRKVAAHRSMDEGRKNRYRPFVALDEIEPMISPDGHDPMLESVLGKLVAKLPDRPRMILILRYQEEMEPGEIAAAMDIPLATVKSNLHRSLAVLRKRIGHRLKGVLQ